MAATINHTGKVLFVKQRIPKRLSALGSPMIPAAAISVLLAFLSDRSRRDSPRVFQRAAAEKGWTLDEDEVLRTPQLWFREEGVLPSPYTFESPHFSISIYKHRGRTINFFLDPDTVLDLIGSSDEERERCMSRYSKQDLERIRITAYPTELERDLGIEPEIPVVGMYVRYKGKDPKPEITGSDYRDVPYLAKHLGFPVVPVAMHFRSPEGWEYHANNRPGEGLTDNDLVEDIRTGKWPWIRGQGWGQAGKFTRLTPLTPQGNSLYTEFTHLYRKMGRSRYSD